MLQRPPLLPTPPAVYDAKYIQELTRVLYLYFQEGANKGELRGTNLVLTDLPGSGAGLPVGGLWRNGESVRVVVSNGVYAPSFVSQTFVGNVQVVT